MPQAAQRICFGRLREAATRKTVFASSDAALRAIFRQTSSVLASSGRAGGRQFDASHSQVRKVRSAMAETIIEGQAHEVAKVPDAQIALLELSFGEHQCFGSLGGKFEPKPL